MTGQPLANRRIVITQERTAGERTAELIRGMGGDAVLAPLIEVHAVADLSELDERLRQLQRYNWLLFTSRNAAAITLERSKALGLSSEDFNSVSIAAVGTGTAAVLEAGGVKIDLIPTRFRWQELAEELIAKAEPGSHILFPRGNLSKTELIERLRSNQLLVDPVVVYETRPAGLAGATYLQRLAETGGAHAILLTSDSAVTALEEALTHLGQKELSFLKPAGCNLPRPLIACLGPNTAAVAERIGIPVDVVAPVARVKSLTAAVAEALARAG